MLIVIGYIFQLEIILVILFVVINAIERYLDVFWCGCSAVRTQRTYNFTFIHLCNSSYGEGPVYLLTDHHQYFAFIHGAWVGNEGEGDLQGAEGLNIKLRFRIVEESEHTLFLLRLEDHFDTDCYVVFEGIAELDRIWVFFQQSVVDCVMWEGDRWQTHSTEFVLPVSNLFGCEFDWSAFYVV